jgi:hypothetical protein
MIERRKLWVLNRYILIIAVFFPPLSSRSPMNLPAKKAGLL